MLGCSSGSKRSCSMNSARPARWTGHGSAWIRSASGPQGGTTPAQTQSIGPSAGPSCTWPLRHGAAADAAGDCGQHQRQPHVRGAAGRPPQGSHPTRWATLPPRQGPRRQGVRQPPLPLLADSPRDQGPHRPPRGRVVGPAGSPSLEGGAVDRLAGRVPTAADPLRPGLRAVLRVRHVGLRAAVLPPPAPHGPGARTVTLTEVPECPLRAYFWPSAGSCRQA